MPSKLEQLQLQFRQKLIKEKEERMIKIHTDRQQKTLSRVAKCDSSPQMSVSPALVGNMARKLNSVSASPLHHQSPTKKKSPGVDRSRPLPPISREVQQLQLKNHQQPSRSNHSSTSSESSTRAPALIGCRTRSMDYEVVSKVNCRTNQEVIKNSHKQNHQDRQSPESNSWSQNQRPQLSTKTNGEFSTKFKNGHQSETNTKSSIHQKATTVTDSNKFPSTQSVTKVGKPRAVNIQSRKSELCKRETKTVRLPPNPNQDQCRYCGRNFNKDRIEKHVSICAKSSQKKVKVFDATKMRVQGTEAESFVRRGVHNTSLASQKAKKSNWKKQHEEFINAIRQAKVAQRHLAAGGKLSDLPPPPPSDLSDYVPCPHCGRKFNEGVAQRHIPKCKNILSNKKTTFKKK